MEPETHFPLTLAASSSIGHILTDKTCGPQQTLFQACCFIDIDVFLRDMDLHDTMNSAPILELTSVFCVFHQGFTSK